jgi:hypothetical protein
MEHERTRALVSYTLLFMLLQRMRPAERNTISISHKETQLKTPHQTREIHASRNPRR